MRILAFAADADLYCPSCAERRYPGCVSGDIKDREGNVVTPIFSTSSDALLQVCADCEEELDPPPSDIEWEVKYLRQMGLLDTNTPTELIEQAYELKQEKEDEREQEEYDDSIVLIRKWMRNPYESLLKAAHNATGVDTEGITTELNMVAKNLGLGTVDTLGFDDLNRVVEAHARELFGED